MFRHPESWRVMCSDEVLFGSFGSLGFGVEVLKELFVFSKSLEDPCGLPALSTRNHMSPNQQAGARFEKLAWLVRHQQLLP